MHLELRLAFVHEFIRSEQRLEGTCIAPVTVESIVLQPVLTEVLVIHICDLKFITVRWRQSSDDLKDVRRIAINACDCQMRLWLLRLLDDMRDRLALSKCNT